LWAAASYYKLHRNFKILPTEERLAGALSAIDEFVEQLTDTNVDGVVCDLAERFRRLYGKYAVSAASKF